MRSIVNMAVDNTGLGLPDYGRSDARTIILAPEV